VDGVMFSAGEKNLAIVPGVRITASVMQPTGGGATSPVVLLNDEAHRLDDGLIEEYAQTRTYDTFHGRYERNDIDWYMLDLPGLVPFNCIEMTMGYPFRDGGWWTSLNVEVRDLNSSSWEPVSHMRIEPGYNFADTRINRRLFESYEIIFDDVLATSVRIIGVPGGLVRFTSLARLAVYHRDLSQRVSPQLVHIPIPHLFRLISPDSVWDLSSGLKRLTGLSATLPLLDYYLDEERLAVDWSREVGYYSGKPYLSMLIGDAIGWDTWPKVREPEQHCFKTSIQPAPFVELNHHRLFAIAVAPVMLDGQTLANITSSEALLPESIDWDWHHHFADQHHIQWAEYKAAMERTPHMNLMQMEGVAEILSMIANSITQVAHRNLILEGELKNIKASAINPSSERRKTIQTAIRFLQENLEEDISITDVARHVSLNPSYFSTIFTEEMGSTPIDMLQRVRIERAKEYLRHTQVTVMDVCVALNYTPSYFNRLFKKLVGMTPGQFGRQHKKMS
jgi:AraC-like DNA-binding protein